MSTQQVPLTYEGVLELFRVSREKLREMREQMKESEQKNGKRGLLKKAKSE